MIAATSRPDLLDGALLRSGRIDRMVEIPLPDRQSRLEILQVLSKTLHFAPDVQLDVFADGTDRFTGADLQSLLTSANMAAVQQYLQHTDVSTVGHVSMLSGERFCCDSATADGRNELPPGG